MTSTTSPKATNRVYWTSDTDSLMKSALLTATEQLVAGRSVRPDLVDLLQHAVGHLHGVGVGLLDDAHADRGLAVEPGQRALVLHSRLGYPHVAEPDRGPVPRS